MAERILGFFFLFIGIGIIVFSLFSSWQMFTGKVEPPQVFSQLSQQDGTTPSQGEFQDVISQQLKSFLPANTVPKILNLSAWSIFAFILMFGGGQISGIGIKLIRK